MAGTQLRPACCPPAHPSGPGPWLSMLAATMTVRACSWIASWPMTSMATWRWKQRWSGRCVGAQACAGQLLHV